MTLAQLRYVITVSQIGTLSEAAKRLYISQPSLTNAIKELEKELGITIFIRTNKGVILSRQGEEFLGYARQVIEQTNLIEEKYLQDHNIKHEFCISTQHYSFAVEAFVSLIKEYGGKEYDFRIRETQTYEIIEDVAKLKSEIGVLYLNSFNEVVLKKTLKENDLTFHRLFIAKPHVFLGKDNPLANKNKVSLEDLKEYIKTIGLYNSKAENIIKTCRDLVEKHNGEVPENREALEAKKKLKYVIVQHSLIY